MGGSNSRSRRLEYKTPILPIEKLSKTTLYPLLSLQKRVDCTVDSIASAVDTFFEAVDGCLKLVDGLNLWVDWRNSGVD
jgi:hypothetical protein